MLLILKYSLEKQMLPCSGSIHWMMHSSCFGRKSNDKTFSSEVHKENGEGQRESERDRGKENTETNASKKSHKLLNLVAFLLAQLHQKCVIYRRSYWKKIIQSILGENIGPSRASLTTLIWAWTCKDVNFGKRSTNYSNGKKAFLSKRSYKSRSLPLEEKKKFSI